MPFDVHGALLVAVVAGVTALIRFLPFVVFGGGRPTPKFVVYLAGVLPCAITAMLSSVFFFHRCSPTTVAPASSSGRPWVGPSRSTPRRQ